MWLKEQAAEHEEMSSLGKRVYEASLWHALREEYKKGMLYLKAAVLPAIVAVAIGIQWAVKGASPFKEVQSTSAAILSSGENFKNSRVVLILFAVVTPTALGVRQPQVLLKVSRTRVCSQ